jgi:hypothetical protein
MRSRPFCAYRTLFKLTFCLHRVQIIVEDIDAMSPLFSVGEGILVYKLLESFWIPKSPKMLCIFLVLL